MYKRIALMVLLLLAFAVPAQAAEQRLTGDPVRILYGELRVGNYGLGATPLTGSVIIEPAGNSSAGTLVLQSCDAGGTLRQFGLQYSQAATGNTTYQWPPAYPAANNYVLESTTLGIMSWGIDDTGEFTLAGSAGSALISNGDTLTVAAGTGILSTPVTAVDTVTINTVWTRAGTQISPVTANDYVFVQNAAPVSAAPTAGAFRAHTVNWPGIWAVSDSAATASIYGTSTSGGGVLGSSSTGVGVYGSSSTQEGVYGTSTSGDGVYGYSGSRYGVEGNSNTTHGVYGLGGAGNDDYGIYSASGTYSDGYYDVSDESSVANPPSGVIRLWAASDGMSYAQTSAGVIHCLTSQGKETHPVSEGLDPNDPGASTGTPANDDGCQCNWTADAMPGGTALAAPVTYTNQCTFSTPAAIGDAVTLDESYGQWAWDAARDDAGHMYFQSWICVGSPFCLFSGDAGTTACKAARAYCRVRVSNTTHWHSIILVLSDSTGANTATSSLLGSMASATWYTGATGIQDISTWTGPLRVSVVAYGRALSDGEAISPEIRVEHVSCEQYAN